MENKVDYYLERIKKYSKQYNNYMNQKKYFSEIRDMIQQLIDNNLDYILTDSLLNYVVHNGISSIRLYQLTQGTTACIRSLSRYYKEIYTEFKRENKEDYMYYIKLLDKETNEACIKAYNYIQNLYLNYDRYHYRLYDVEQIIYIVLAYCHLNKKLNEFDNVCGIFINNPYDTLDDLYINDIRDPIGSRISDNDELLIDRVITKIESKNTLIK